eukprot:7186253-Prorocentrum_lima.AAC.1
MDGFNPVSVDAEYTLAPMQGTHGSLIQANTFVASPQQQLIGEHVYRVPPVPSFGTPTQSAYQAPGNYLRGPEHRFAFE